VQLADEAVAASVRAVDRCTGVLRLDEGCRTAICGADTAVTVSGLNGGSVDYENEQQQTDSAPEGGAAILKCAVQHARHYRIC
jgi:hypothetical protein